MFAWVLVILSGFAVCSITIPDLEIYYRQHVENHSFQDFRYYNVITEIGKLVISRWYNDIAILQICYAIPNYFLGLIFTTLFTVSVLLRG